MKRKLLARTKIGSAGGLLAAACCLLMLLAGCPQPDSTDNGESDRLIPEGVRLRLMVIGDPDLADAIAPLRGEWNAQTGSEFEVHKLTANDLSQLDDADAILGPSHLLGPLAEAERIVPVPQKLLEDDEAEWSEIFSMLRADEAVWGREVHAVPFGSPVLTCYYRADLLENLGRDPPETWEEYHELATLLADPANLAAGAGDRPRYGAAEPLGPGWGGLLLLARAAAYATHHENYSALLSIDTADPLIDGPPFVRALQELVAIAKLGPPQQLDFSPADAREVFWQGECAMALCWPGAAARMVPSSERAVRVGFAELPGSLEVYDIVDRRWEKRLEGAQRRVPLLATSGRMGMVTARSQWPEPAFHLLLWLADTQRSRQIGPASPATTLFRRSHLESPRMWVEKQVPAAEAAQYAATLKKTLSGEQRMFALRIPGRAEYLAALDDAVHRAVRGDQTPEESLAEAAAQWRTITDRLGPDQQRQAYRHSLGLN